MVSINCVINEYNERNYDVYVGEIELYKGMIEKYI